MCVEVYHPGVPLEIPFAHEVIRFTSAVEWEVKYCFLARNLSHRPIEHLYALYPRSLFNEPQPFPRPVGELLPDLEDITDRLPRAITGFDNPPDWSDYTLRVDDLPDPNRPEVNRAPLTGTFRPGTSELALPPRFGPAQIYVLRLANLTAWRVRFEPKLGAYEARWFWWRIRLKDLGIRLPPQGSADPALPRSTTPLGCPLVLHEVASPLDVRRRFIELLESGLRDAELEGDEDGQTTYGEAIRGLGLRRERQVDIQYYQLTVLPGKPEDRLIVSWQMDRDLRMLQQCPRVGKEEPDPVGELIYEWRTGSLLKPDHAWKDQGFALHLLLAYRD
jgi:hypothetical protein